MKAIKLGVLSVCGHYKRRLQVPLRNHRSIELTAIGSRNLARASSAAKDWGFAKALGSYQEVVDDPDVEAIYIPLPNSMHAEWIKKCADAGKAVLCEKPIALNTPEAIESLEYAEKKGVPVMECFMYKFHPQWLKARELVTIGEIGTIQAIHTILCFHNTDTSNIRNIKEVGGGAMLDIGCYAISSSRYLLNDEPARVSAVVHYDQKLGIDTYANGSMLFGSDTDSPCTHFTVSTRMKGQQKLTVYGSKGCIVIDRPFNAWPDIPLKVIVDDGDTTREILCGPADQYDLLFDAFANVCRGASVPGFASPADAIANMKVIDAVSRAAKSGQWEKV